MTPPRLTDAPPEIFSEPLNVTIALRTKRALRELAHRDGTSVAHIVRAAVDRAVSDAPRKRDPRL